jgi:hypothetical protein
LCTVSCISFPEFGKKREELENTEELLNIFETSKNFNERKLLSQTEEKT